MQMRGCGPEMLTTFALTLLTPAFFSPRASLFPPTPLSLLFGVPWPHTQPISSPGRRSGDFKAVGFPTSPPPSFSPLVPSKDCIVPMLWGPPGDRVGGAYLRGDAGLATRWRSGAMCCKQTTTKAPVFLKRGLQKLEASVKAPPTPYQ